MEIPESLQEGSRVLLATKSGILIKGTVKNVSKEKKSVTLEEEDVIQEKPGFIHKKVGPIQVKNRMEHGAWGKAQSVKNKAQS